MKLTLILFTSLLILTGCKGLNSVVTCTQTGLGVSVSENPSTQLYEARFGYFRNEFAYVPGNTNDPASVPNVMMEIRMENILKGGLVYQRLCVGSEAVRQPGATLLFAKSQDGSVDPAVAQALVGARTVPASDAAGTAAKLPLAKAFSTSDQKAKFDSVAVAQGYASFSDFLAQPALTAAQVAAMRAELTKAGLALP